MADVSVLNVNLYGETIGTLTGNADMHLNKLRLR